MSGDDAVAMRARLVNASDVITHGGESSSQVAVVGPITSVYFRDPDANLIEIANYAVT